jgi:hypothetical protein
MRGPWLAPTAIVVAAFRAFEGLIWWWCGSFGTKLVRGGGKTLLVDAACRECDGFSFRMGGAGPRALPWASIGRAVGALAVFGR